MVSGPVEVGVFYGFAEEVYLYVPTQLEICQIYSRGMIRQSFRRQTGHHLIEILIWTWLYSVLKMQERNTLVYLKIYIEIGDKIAQKTKIGFMCTSLSHWTQLSGR